MYPRKVVAPDAPVADAPEPASPPGIEDGKPYIQVGIFAGQENIDRIIERLTGAGLDTETRPLVMDGAKLTRVLVGPFGTIADRERALETVREIGPADAYPVRG